MPYTLAKFFFWGLLLALAGGVIGWMLRSLLCRREVAAARAATVDDEEVDRMRHRLANLEAAVVERDRLREQLASSKALATAGAGAAVTKQGFAALGDSDVAEPVAAAADAANEAADEVADAANETADAAAAAVGEAEEAPTLDLDAAAAAIGSKIKLDDLTVVEGIGPKIAELCAGIGVSTWQQLADTDVGILRTMLEDAGSRFQMHDPGTWPRQAGLLATGQWEAFKQLTDELDGGK